MTLACDVWRGRVARGFRAKPQHGDRYAQLRWWTMRRRATVKTRSRGRELHCCGRRRSVPPLFARRTDLLVRSHSNGS
jgi:hypothetical protein